MLSTISLPGMPVAAGAQGGAPDVDLIELLALPRTYSGICEEWCSTMSQRWPFHR